MSSSPPGQTGPPYAPQFLGLGGLPTIIPDVPISAVFAFLFLVTAVAHIIIFKTNNKVGHKFKLNIPMFIFCFIRVFSAILRIIWATRQRNVRLAIAAQVFVAAGSLILYILNLLFTQRIVRALHPRIGWSKPGTAFFAITIAITIVSLLMVITVAIQSFFTLSHNTLRIDHDIILYVSTLFSFVSFLPIPLIALAYIIPRTKQIDYFGTGSFRAKVAIVLGGAVLICAGASFRAGTAYLPPVPVRSGRSPGYLSKEAFYCMDLLIDLIVVAMWAITRVDQRFWVPNGSKGSYYPHPEKPSKYADIEKSVALADYTSRSSVYAKQSTTSLINTRTRTMDTETESVWTLPTTELDFDRRSGKWSLKRASNWSMGTSVNGQRMAEEWTILGREDASMPNRTTELQRKWGATAAAHVPRPRTSSDTRPPSALFTRPQSSGRPRSGTASSTRSHTGGRVRSLTAGSAITATTGTGRPSTSDGTGRSTTMNSYTTRPSTADGNISPANSQ